MSRRSCESDLSSRLARMELELLGGGQEGTGPGGVDLEILECPVCFETCLPPSYTCKNGHLVCGKCKNKGVHHCPICRDETLKLAQELDDFTRRFRFQCSNRALGCTEIFALFQAKTHEETCSFRLEKKYSGFSFFIIDLVIDFITT